MIVQSLWIGYELSPMEQLCINSFIYHGHEFHLYTYDKIKNVPKKCIIKNGDKIIPKKEIFYYTKNATKDGKSAGSVSAFSNMFRYKLLYDKGGYWVDMDMVCLKQFDFDSEYVFSSERYKGKQIINAGVIKCPLKSDFAKYCYEISKKKDKEKLKWGEIGPKLVRQSIYKYDLLKYVQKPDIFCPIYYNELNKFILPNKFKINEKWYGIHLWNECWKRQGLNKNKVYNKKSFYEQMKLKYSVNLFYHC